jgi:hypothetical protein
MASLKQCSDETLIKAELPDTRQTGEFLLKRTYSAPRSLDYSPVKFSGDEFVKHQVIARVLQGEVNHVKKGDGPTLAVVEDNYKFAFKGAEHLNGQAVYAFEVKPRRKKSGLFKGKIFIDCRSGHIVRATGRLSPSPSWWIKKVVFTKDYADIDSFTLPVRIQALAQARVIGRVSITVLHDGYQVSSVDEKADSKAATGAPSN